jgi:HNH endonuclease
MWLPLAGEKQIESLPATTSFDSCMEIHMRKPGEIVKPLWDRFHEKVSPEALTGCWIWTGAVKEKGYGVIGLGTRRQGTAKAHRVAYELHKGKIAEGMNILHDCDNPSCVNPNHLYEGTFAQNSQDCVRRKRNFVPNNRGELSNSVKLTLEQVNIIRKKEKTGRQYAKDFGVSKSTVFAIWRNVNWKYD